MCGTDQTLRGLYAITDSQLLAGKLLPYVEAALEGETRRPHLLLDAEPQRQGLFVRHHRRRVCPAHAAARHPRLRQVPDARRTVAIRPRRRPAVSHRFLRCRAPRIRITISIFRSERFPRAILQIIVVIKKVPV